MAVRAYLYNQDQSPLLDTDRHFGRRLDTYHAECNIDRDLVEGDLVSLHVGHGSFNEFRVAACDGDTALLVRKQPF